MRSVLGPLVDLRGREMPPTWRKALVALASVAILAASIWSWRSSDLDVGDIRWTPICLAFLVGGPASIAAKAYGYVVAAHLVGQRPGVKRAARVGVVSSAANLLPVPGSMIVTVRSLAQDGSTPVAATTASFVPALSWIAFAGTVGGAAMLFEGSTGAGSIVTALGAAAGVGAWVAFARVAPATGRWRLLAELVAAQAAWLAVSALRLGLAMSSIGLDFRPTRAFALSVAGAATSAVGFVPGGLGLREGLIAALAPTVDLTVEAGVLIGTIDRVVWMLALAAALALVGRQATRSSDAADDRERTLA